MSDYDADLPFQDEEKAASGDLTTNKEEVEAFKRMVDGNSNASFLCTRIKADNPNYLAITYANQVFCQTFKQEQNDLLGKSHDFLFDEIDVNYSSEDQLEYIRLVKSVKDHEPCSIIMKLDNHFDGEHQIAKFKISFKPVQDDEKKKFYAIFSFEKISEEVIENEETSNVIKTQNQALIKNLERALSSEKLLREISYLIISDKPVKEIAQNISESLCKALKVDRCIIHDFKDEKPKFIVEFCNPHVKSTLEDQEIADYVNFQTEFYGKIKKSSQKSSLYMTNDIMDNSSFDKIHDFLQKFSVNSQVAAITSFDGVINGGIYIHSSQNRDLTVDEIELVELVADQLAIAIDRSYSIEKVMVANHNLLSKTLELKEAIKKEKEMRKMQTEFVALVSHEFKTPLQIIDSTRELILRKVKKLQNDDSLDKFFLRIKTAIKRMTGLIDTTLDLAKLESGNGEIEVNKAEFDVHDLIKDILDKTSNLTTEKNIKIEVDLCAAGARILGDEKLLDHCFTNIISNAIKYSKDASGEQSVVKIVSKTNNDKVAIRVTDQGIGIPEDDVAKIGQKFFRAKNTLAVSGTGIGIYLTKYFIDLHNGSVKIDSKLNVGTSFTVILPRK